MLRDLFRHVRNPVCAREMMDRAGRGVVEPLERRTLMAAGVLDTSFNGTGEVTTKFRSTNDAVAVAFQSDGKAIVVGDTQAQGGTKDAFVARYNVDGTLDTTFANGGVTFLERGFDEIATGVAIQSDGKIVVCGVSGTLSSLQGNGFVIRYNPDGSTDTTFNGTGSKTIDWGGGDAATGVAVTSQGRIIVVGTSLSGASSGIAIAFLNSDGSFDTTYGTGQVVTSPGLGTFEAGTAIALAPTAGRFYVSGTSFNALGGGARFMVAEFNIDGSLATSFGDQGRAFASFGQGVELATGVAVDPTSNKVVAAGTSANGVIEFSPGLGANLPSAPATQADFAVARFNTDGSLDNTFGSGGEATVDFTTNGASNLDGASDVVVQPDGKVVASGGSQVRATGNSQFATARFTTGGALDTSFGTGGRVLTSFSSSTSDGSFGMGLQSDGKIYEVGHSKTNASDSSVALVRYTNDTSPGPVPGTPAISVSNVTVAEPSSGTAPANFVVSLSQSSTSTVTVAFATADGTAKAGQDYTATNGTLTFGPGETSKTVTVQVLADGTAGNKTFSLNLSNPSNATITAAAGTGTITAGPVLVPGINVTKVKVGKLPKNVVGGQPNAKAPVTVTLLNNTNATVRVPVQVTLYGSTDQVADPKTDPKLGSAKPTVQLGPHKSMNVTVNAKFPKVPANENLFVVAVATGRGVPNASGVQGSSTTTVLVQQAVTKLVGSTKPQANRAVKYNQTVNVKAPVTNKGNVAANGTAMLGALISTDGTTNPSSIVLASTLPNQAIRLNVNQTGQFQFRFKTPASSSQLAPGKYTLLIRLTKAKVKNATNTTDGSIIAVVPFTIS